VLEAGGWRDMPCGGTDKERKTYSLVTNVVDGWLLFAGVALYSLMYCYSLKSLYSLKYWYSLIFVFRRCQEEGATASPSRSETFAESKHFSRYSPCKVNRR
jgi:hypothetical protein